MTRIMQSGDMVGGYQLVDELGAGGFGSVWRARDARGRIVALKLLKQVDDGTRSRFEREARALARLRHPNCVAFLAFEQTADGTPYLVTDFAEGVSLRTWAEERPQSIEDVVTIARQIASALVAAHEAGISHRDLKPDNVVVLQTTRGLDVKVLDFGLAKLSDEQGDLTKTGEVIGTPGFMSPEQLRGLKGTGPSTDLYCLGVILYELVEGRPPFTGRSALEISMKHLLDPVPPMSDAVPEPLRAMVMGLLEKDIANRPHSAREVLAVLSDGRGMPRATALVIGALVLAGILVAGATTLLPDSPDEPQRPLPRELVAPARASPPRPVPPPAFVDASVPKRHGTLGCGKPQVPGRQQFRMRPGLRTIEHEAYIPDPYDPDEPHAVLVLFHDHGQDGAGVLREMATLQEQADKRGMILIAPNKRDPIDRAAWYDNALIGAVWEDVLALEDILCIDRDRYFVMGHGDGGWAADLISRTFPGVRSVIVDSFRYRPDQAAATESRTGEPMPALMIAALGDDDSPREGAEDNQIRPPWEDQARVSLEDHIQLMRSRNGCGAKRRQTRAYRSDRCFEYEECTQPLVVCELGAVGHWPGWPVGKGGHLVPSRAFPYAEVVMEFLDGVRP